MSKMGSSFCLRCVHTARQTSQAPAPLTAPKKPFFQTKVHTIPTLWSAYRTALAQTRRLLRFNGVNARLGSKDEVLDALRAKWRKQKGMTSLKNTKAFLVAEMDRASVLCAANEGDMTALATAKTEFDRIRARQARITARKQVNNAKYKDPRPRLTGGHLRPTLFNGPLPRLKPQPLSLSMMLRSRLRARERRREKHIELNILKNDLERETQFAKRLGLDYAKDFSAGIAAFSRTLEKSFELEKRRAEEKFEPELLERIQAARTRRESYHRARAAQSKAGAAER